MKALVVGSGGREHAIAWRLSTGGLVKKVYIAPGNAGTGASGTNVPIKAEDIAGLAEFALKEKIDLTVVGPEVPLTLGITDEFERAGLRIFGPSKAASEIEGSKAFAKDFMSRHGIPTAGYGRFTDPVEAREYIHSEGVPCVVKADGLAAGKGVIVCRTIKEAEEAVDLIMRKKAFGPAGERVIVEEFLEGEEASFLAVTDGEAAVALPGAQDHKTVYDGDRGPNTGGMGAYSPAPVLTPEIEKEVMETVIMRTVKGMEKEGRPYKGVLYAGLMITKDGPRVLEFNCRFGDPETQPILMRLGSDLAELLLASVEGGIGRARPRWRKEASVCVVMASGGYPGEYERGKEIRGLKEAASIKDVMVFHAGTAVKNDSVVTNGGRVLGVTSLGAGLKEAIERAYTAVEKISWDGVHYRRDIGRKALLKETASR